jgi:hypothetical protein
MAEGFLGVKRKEGPRQKEVVLPEVDPITGVVLGVDDVYARAARGEVKMTLPSNSAHRASIGRSAMTNESEVDRQAKFLKEEEEKDVQRRGQAEKRLAAEAVEKERKRTEGQALAEAQSVQNKAIADAKATARLASSNNLIPEKIQTLKEALTEMASELTDPKMATPSTVTDRREGSFRREEIPVHEHIPLAIQEFGAIDIHSSKEGRKLSKESLLKNQLRELGAKKVVIKKSEKGKVFSFLFPNEKGRPIERSFYLNGVADFIREQQTVKEKTPSTESSHKEKGEEKIWELVEGTTAVLRPLSKETISEIQKILKRPQGWRNIPAPLKKALKEAGFNVRVSTVGTAEAPGDILMLSGVDDKGNEIIIPGVDNDGVVFYLRNIVEKSTQEMVFGSDGSYVEEGEVPVVNDELTDVDESGAINPNFVNKDLEKSDQGAGVEKLDINEYRKIQYKQEEERRVDVDFIAQQEENAEKARLLSLSEQKKLEQERENKIVAATTFEELEDVLRGIGDIQGSRKVYPVENEILRIKAFRERYITAPTEVYGAVLKLFTNTYHLRDKIDQLVKKEREVIGEKIKQELEDDVIVRWFDKEAFDFPERYDEVWDRFVATHPEKAVLYREHNPGIRSALERKEAKVEVFKKESKPEKQRFFDTRFETEFGITEEQISEIEGYERLSEGQVKLVLENLREYARDTRGGITARTWEGILKAVGRDTKDKSYVDAATVLIRNTAQFGPKVHEENRELLTDFIDVGIPQQFRKEHKPVFDRFNALAHQYAKMKVEDLEDGIGTHSKDESKIVAFFKNTFSESRRKHDAYEALQESYESAKRALAESLAKMGKSEGEIAEKLVQIESKVHSLRFLQTEPEAVDVIKQNPEQGFWQKVGEKVFSKENMAYAGLGFVGRMALTGAMGLYAAPAVASALGGVRSWNKTAAELREKDRMARGGRRDTSDEALNIVDATREIKVGQGGKKDVGLTQKLRDLIRDYQNETAKDNVTGEEKTKSLERIQARVAYVEDKINLNRINFGSGVERSTNMASLFEVLSEARILLADTEMPKESELGVRLERYLVKREGFIQTRRRKKQIKTAAWNTLKAGAFALAGRELAEYVQETGFFSKGGSVAGGAVGSTASVPESAEMSPLKQYGYQAETPVVDSGTSEDTVRLTRSGSVGIEDREVPKNFATRTAGVHTPPVPESGMPSQTAEELQKMSVEKGDSVRLYSDMEPNTAPEAEKDLSTETPPQDKAGESIQKAQTPEAPEGEPAKGVARMGESDIKVQTEATPARPEVSKPDPFWEPELERSNTPSETLQGNDSVSGDVGDAASVEQSKGGEEGVPSGEGARMPKDIEVSDDVIDAQVEGGSSRPRLVEGSTIGKESVSSDIGTSPDNSIGSDIRTPESALPDYADDGGTALDTESGATEVKTTPDTMSSQEVFKNANGVEVEPKKEHIYELNGRDGEKVMVSYGGKDFETRFDTAQEYVKKNPEAVVIVEEEPRYGVFGQKLPPSYVEVRNLPGEGVATIFSIQDNTLPASSEKGIDPATFTKKVTK